MKILIPVKPGNNSIADKSMSAVFNEFVASADPESSFFFLEDGKRAAIFIFEEKRQDKLMAYNENFFAVLGAEIWVTPVLTHKELKKHM
ncbi:hypothetical protein P3339_13180 [Microbulbifer sp. MLAF003]|nr:MULTISPECIES: hypothetical protein [Microbulbifer]WHI49427.1 hypothetical protein P3339_13180 [Microbulbifer sp. MLAF003]